MSQRLVGLVALLMSSPLTTVLVSSATEREDSADEYEHLEALKTMLLRLSKLHL